MVAEIILPILTIRGNNLHKFVESEKALATYSSTLDPLDIAMGFTQ